MKKILLIVFIVSYSIFGFSFSLYAVTDCGSIAYSGSSGCGTSLCCYAIKVGSQWVCTRNPSVPNASCSAYYSEKCGDYTTNNACPNTCCDWKNNPDLCYKDTSQTGSPCNLWTN